MSEDHAKELAESQTADQFLASRTDEQLARALVRGNEQLRLINELEQSEGFCPEGPFPVSKAYERWSANDYAERRRRLEMAIRDTLREQQRRAHQPNQPQGRAS